MKTIWLIILLAISNLSIMANEEFANKTESFIKKNSTQELDYIEIARDFYKRVKENKPIDFSTFSENEFYKIYDDSTQWDKGIVMFYIGKKKLSYKGNFLERLGTHVDLIKDTMTSLRVLNAYYVFSNPDYEVAIMNWTSLEDIKRAFSTPEGKIAGADSKEFMERVIWVSVDFDKL